MHKIWNKVKLIRIRVRESADVLALETVQAWPSLAKVSFAIRVLDDFAVGLVIAIGLLARRYPVSYTHLTLPTIYSV